MTTSEPHRSVVREVAAIFRELAGERAGQLVESKVASETLKLKIVEALSEEHGDSSDDIGFHLTDWSADAAFLVALHLFPERFSAEEIRAGVTNLVIHAPNHLAAAAKLAGYPIQDVFGLGTLVEADDT